MRNDLRLKIEGLSLEWKKSPLSAQNHEDESHGEVEFVDFPHIIGKAASMDWQPSNHTESDEEVEFVETTQHS